MKFNEIFCDVHAKSGSAVGCCHIVRAKKTLKHFVLLIFRNTESAIFDRDNKRLIDHMAFHQNFRPFFGILNGIIQDILKNLMDLQWIHLETNVLIRTFSKKNFLFFLFRQIHLFSQNNLQKFNGVFKSNFQNLSRFLFNARHRRQIIHKSDHALIAGNNLIQITHLICVKRPDRTIFQ